MDKFTQEIIKLEESNEMWQGLTGYEEPPERLDKLATSDAHTAYASYLDQTFSTVVSPVEDEKAPKNAPVRLSYSRVTYGIPEAVTTKTPSTSTHETEVSTISASQNKTDQEQLKKTITAAFDKIQAKTTKYNEETKTSLLNEMRKLNKTSNDRASFIETQGNNYEKNDARNARKQPSQRKIDDPI